MLSLGNRADAAFVFTPLSTTVQQWTTGTQQNKSADHTNYIELNYGVSVLYTSTPNWNVNPVTFAEVGPAMHDYTMYAPDTLPNPNPAPSSGRIVHDGANYLAGTVFYLYLKDGNEGSYLYSLFGWDGMEDISWSGFWKNQEKLSHATILGTATLESVPSPITGVPEPASMALWLTAAVGGAFYRRRRKAVC